MEDQQLGGVPWSSLTCIDRHSLYYVAKWTGSGGRRWCKITTMRLFSTLSMEYGITSTVVSLAGQLSVLGITKRELLLRSRTPYSVQSRDRRNTNATWLGKPIGPHQIQWAEEYVFDMSRDMAAGSRH
jgi:hypothetical protein